MMFRAGKKQAKDVYLYEPIGADKEGNEISLLDIIESLDEDIVDSLSLKENVTSLYQFIDKVLTRREKEIIVLRYGLFRQEAVTQREIADMMGISRSYVSRIEKKALYKLKQSFKKA
ncbi:sigma-70 family RNA polymerase sigma factor [Anaerolentibacter hominis]|uniref:sigma-70 family RNA polymerase sigma factor n=1 Tax=Anaerolentibacter hominis TaxID=3079009 RepID=UPI0031B837A4